MFVPAQYSFECVSCGMNCGYYIITELEINLQTRCAMCILCLQLKRIEDRGKVFFCVNRSVHITVCRMTVTILQIIIMRSGPGSVSMDHRSWRTEQEIKIIIHPPPPPKKKKKKIYLAF